MASRDDLNKLRRSIAQLRGRASRKINDLESRGINISGSQFDVLSSGDPKRMNKRQLISLQDKLRNFNSKEVDFVAGKGGTPISAQTWGRYKSLEDQQNAQSLEFWENHKHIKLLHDEPLDAIMERQSRKARLRDSAGYSEYDLLSRSPGRITSEKALEELNKNMEDRIEKGVIGRVNEAMDKSIYKMMDALGWEEAKEKFEELTDEQKAVVWQYTNLPNELSAGYENHKALVTKGDRAVYKNLRNSAERAVLQWLDWAATI